MTHSFQVEAIIDNTSDMVWLVLTEASGRQAWLGDPEMEIQSDTLKYQDQTFQITGFHHVPFTVKGKVITYEPNSCLIYTQLDSISNLDDVSSNYTTIKFELETVKDATKLRVTLENFPTETIRKHLEFYWKTTVFTIKKQVESLG